MKRMAVIILLLFTVMIPVTAVYAETNKDQVSVGGDVNIDKDTTGSVVAVGGDVTIDKDINGSVVAVFGDVKVNAKVSGDVVSVLGKVKLTDKAEVGGSLISVGKLDRADKARINGENVIISTGDIDIGDFHMEYGELMALIKIVSLISFIVMTLLFGLPILAIFARTFKAASIDMEDRLGYKLSIGFLGLLGCFIITVLFSWTVIVPLVFYLLIIFARVTASIYFGKAILNVFDARLNRFMEFFTGFLSIIVAKLIIILLLPEGGIELFGFVIGWDILLTVLFDIFISILGLGVLIYTRLNKKKINAPII